MKKTLLTRMARILRMGCLRGGLVCLPDSDQGRIVMRRDWAYRFAWFLEIGDWRLALSRSLSLLKGANSKFVGRYWMLAGMFYKEGGYA